jgi:MFS family permease
VTISSALVDTTIPARLDRLRWGRFHTLVVAALGITWILDGLEVTLAGAISPALKESHRLRFSNADVGLVSSAYLAGAVLGAIFFGWLTDWLPAQICVLHPTKSPGQRNRLSEVFPTTSCASEKISLHPCRPHFDVAWSRTTAV